MKAAKPKAAAPPIILAAFEAALLDFAEGLAEEAFEPAGDVDVGRGIEEVRVTPTASHTCWATDSAVWRSVPLQLDSKH